MSNYNLKAIQEIELEILDEIKRICDKHNLRFCLIGGSCIGAIRHKGIIPWDDDIDLGMPRKDYEQLMKIAKTELRKEYFFQNFDSEPHCGFIFGKIRRNDTVLSEEYSYKLNFHQGVWVDIFPYDNISDKLWKRKLDFWQLSIFKNLYIIKCGYSMPKNKSGILKIFYYVAKLASKLFSQKYLISQLKKIMTQYNDKKTKNMLPYGGAYGKKDIVENDIFENPIIVEFEQRKLYIYSKYDHYLQSLYGNYMELPPEDKRNGGSHFIREFKDYR